MAAADNIMVKIEVKASDLVEACIKALIEDGTLVEVVRCKDCKHLSEDRIAPEWQRICRWLGVGKSDDGFCDKGKRRE